MYLLLEKKVYERYSIKKDTTGDTHEKNDNDYGDVFMVKLADDCCG